MSSRRTIFKSVFSVTAFSRKISLTLPIDESMLFSHWRNFFKVDNSERTPVFFTVQPAKWRIGWLTWQLELEAVLPAMFLDQCAPSFWFDWCVHILAWIVSASGEKFGVSGTRCFVCTSDRAMCMRSTIGGSKLERMPVQSLTSLT